MLIGKCLRATVGSTSYYYSPWFRRRGSKAILSCHMIENSDVSLFQISLQTKVSFEDFSTPNLITVAGGPANIGLTPDSITTFIRGNGINGDAAVGMCDMVRLTYSLRSLDKSSAWVHFRLLNIAWEE